jgi:hypothetical protein
MCKRNAETELLLTVAGVSFRLTYPGLPPPATDDPEYSDFVTHRALKNAAANIAVSARNCRLPRALAGTVRFDAGAWSLADLGRDRKRLAHGPSWPCNRTWDAVFDRRVTRVQLRCAAPTGTSGNPLRYPVDQLLLMHHLAWRSGMIVHGAGALIDGRVVLLAGASGAGKTTLSRRLFAAHTDILSDDRMVVRRRGRTWWAYGTPWPGDGGFAFNRGGPLSAILLLERGVSASVNALPTSDTLRAFLPVVSIPWYDVGMTRLLLASCDSLLGAVPVRRLAATLTPATIALVRQAARGVQ